MTGGDVGNKGFFDIGMTRQQWIATAILGAILAPIGWFLISASAEDAAESERLTINAADVDGEWPLKVEAPVQAYCPRGDAVLAIQVGGQTYPINGTARSFGRDRDWAALEDIWKKSGDVARVNIGPMIDAVAGRCSSS